MQHLPIIPPSTKNRYRKHRNAKVEWIFAIISAVLAIVVSYLAILNLPQ